MDSFCRDQLKLVGKSSCSSLGSVPLLCVTPGHPGHGRSYQNYSPNQHFEAEGVAVVGIAGQIKHSLKNIKSLFRLL